MPDIALYTETPDQYNYLQHLRPDYIEAVAECVRVTSKYCQPKEVQLLDLCCGTGSNSVEFTKTRPVAKVELVDINQDFLRIAKSSGIVANNLVVVNSDVRQYRPKREFNLVFSIFAYHHLPDSDKQRYVDVIKTALVDGGLLLLAEIFFQDKSVEKTYYEDLYKAIPQEKRSEELKRFLEETANSTDFEFKVQKTFADNQFLHNSFRLLEEHKIWPNDRDENGTFVQIYRYHAEL